MKLVSTDSSSGPLAAVLTQDETRVIAVTTVGAPADMVELIRDFARWREPLRRLAASADGLPIAGQRLLAPLRPIRNLFCVGKNYREHAREFGSSGFDSGSLGGNEQPDAPIVFSKPPSTVIATGTAIPAHRDPFDSVDYEGELAVVIGRTAAAVDETAAEACVFGYTILNDVTAREAQRVHKQWLLGKGIDGFAPMGPCLVTAEQLEPLAARRLTTHVNGELRQSELLSQLIYSVPALIATISRYITLQPGDVIATGTPAGVGIGFKPPKFLRRGDLVRIAIDGIGVLENPVD
jgi:2-keto-4-pentenoate hydratase/2-oxohepta-3-ene-1,7-dioic acid hydratase in catechol pathway